jgi:hypothetical protein
VNESDFVASSLSPSRVSISASWRSLGRIAARARKEEASGDFDQESKPPLALRRLPVVGPYRALHVLVSGYGA